MFFFSERSRLFFCERKWEVKFGSPCSSSLLRCLLFFFDRCMEIHKLRFGDCYVSCLVFPMWRLPRFEKIGPFVHLNKKRLTMGVLSLLKCHIFFSTRCFEDSDVDILGFPFQFFVGISGVISND